MFAALSMADGDLATRALDRSFGFSAGDVDVEGGEAREAMRGKILRTVQGCREMLEREPPERMDEYWGTVSFLALQPRLLPGFVQCLRVSSPTATKTSAPS